MSATKHVDHDRYSTAEYKEDDEVHLLLERLSKITRTLREIALFLTFVTIVNFFSGAALSAFNIGLPQYFSSFFILMSFLCGGIAMLLAFLFDATRRDGDAFFEELSDELHGKNVITEETHPTKLSLKARVTIRRYSNVVSVPLFPGRQGPAVMALVNMLLPFAALIVFSITK